MNINEISSFEGAVNYMYIFNSFKSKPADGFK